MPPHPTFTNSHGGYPSARDTLGGVPNCVAHFSSQSAVTPISSGLLPAGDSVNPLSESPKGRVA